ncbi:MAG TPA: PLP-dependent aspartate aminotransferase family protein [Pyrinomonadaceae bacterium]|nr:PLP-dependent aspartate aminotransferase family protein [Pyrinomonadaceae bacterium]
MSEKSFETLAVHAGEDLSGHHGAVSVPIYNASVFAFSDADSAAAIHNYEKPGWFYGRLGNPTQDALENAMCELEGGESSLAFASGMAAVTASILTVVKAGDHIIAPQAHYSTTGNFLEYLSENFNVQTTYIDQTNPENYRNTIQENTKIFYLETPSNPTLKISDLAAIAKIAQENSITAICDNTFATPFNQLPLTLGIDVVLHSATKYLGGHSDLTAGVIVGKQGFIENTRLKTTKLFGGNIAPQTAWLVLRGIKTLALRMERHNENANKIANFLAEHPKVLQTNYPGLISHPNHETAKKQMRGFGGMISFDVGSVENGKTLLNNVRLCALATSLGGVETIIQHSASMTHAGVPRDECLKAGITDGLIRLSVGIENAEDLIEDLDQALEKI